MYDLQSPYSFYYIDLLQGGAHFTGTEARTEGYVYVSRESPQVEGKAIQTYPPHVPQLGRLVVCTVK